MRTGVACEACGTGLREHAKFCDECGASTAASGDTPKYKQVTVLFADVVHSMDMAAALDPERLRDIMTELVEHSAAVVRRYGGTVEYTGDGVMALFGAPVALEDHAFRACLAALDIQDEANRLAADVQRADGVALRLRVGLDSGQVIAGEIGSGSLGYAATGETVGVAQRMQSVAPSGGVLLSESTARLVEHTVTLSEPQWVHIKGHDAPVQACRLLAISPRDGLVRRTETSLVGRHAEMAALDAILDHAIGGRGAVVTVVGAPGIGKSRVAREAATLAAGRGVEVVWGFCESHAREVPFHAVTGLLRAGTGIGDLDGEAARARVRERVPDADPQDLLLLDDLLGIADPEVPTPQIDPDARRRRLTALINTASLARTAPALFLIEDAHWIDSVSESMLADFLSVIPHTPAMVLITSRPEYQGALGRILGAQTITLGPLGDSDATALLSELLGSDPSVGELTTIVAERAAGNPFFAEEMVRGLAQRGVLAGERGNYLCHANAADVAVPATVQAAIGARIDRLNHGATRTLHAASVIGARFGTDLLAALGIDPVVDELVAAELIDQVRSAPSAEYAFRHPLIWAVAYESQLKSDRAQWHRRLATSIQEHAPGLVEEHAALIAEHLEAAGELVAAYGWHMRAGAWSTHRDIAAARVSWERASRIADALPADQPDRTALRIAPRTMLCVTALRVRANVSSSFTELRELCTESGDKASLAVGMTGPTLELLLSGHAQEASRLAAEQMALLESIDDPTLTVGLAPWAISIWFDTGEIGSVLRWSQTAIELAGGDPTTGASLGFGSPLAVVLAARGAGRWWLGRSGWRADLDTAVAMARDSDPMTRTAVLNFKYSWSVFYGVLQADDRTVPEIEEVVRTAEGSSDDAVLSLVKFTLGIALVHRVSAADHQRGLGLLMQVRGMWLRERSLGYALPLLDICVARERARSGDRDDALLVMRKAVDDLHQAGRSGVGLWGAAMLVETLLDRATEGDVAEAQMAFDRLANIPADDHLVVRDVWLLRLRALLARARGDDVAYGDWVQRYRALAESLGFEGHMAMAAAM